MKTVPAELPQPEKIDAALLAERILAGEIDLPVVLGPTASGKTRYAVGLAREFASRGLAAEIISADSRQVFRGMDIGTGKDLSEYGDVPYHLIDILPAGQKYSVFAFRSDFQKAFGDIRGRGAVPILCGGTGLYINSVLNDYDFRSSVPLSESREIAAGALKAYVIGTLVDRETRNKRIDARLDERLEEGMVDEIRGLLESGVSAENLISYGLEYKFVTLYLQGELSYGQMREKLAVAIHQFAKRQMTWFRGMERSGVKIHWTRV